jgi:hypothetical protein
MSFSICDPDVRVELNDGKGRTLVSNRTFQFGEIVLRDEPLIVFTTASSLLSKFSLLPKEKQDIILDLCHPPLDIGTPRMQQRRMEAAPLASDLGIPEQKVLKLLAIADTNSHAFRNQEERGNEDKKTKKKKKKKKNMKQRGHCKKDNKAEEQRKEKIEQRVVGARSALFGSGAMASHSCDPNACYSSKSGYLQYRAIRRIQKDEEITISYIDPYMHVQDRRDSLFETKNFVCTCFKCTGPDYYRQLKCPMGKKCSMIPQPQLARLQVDWMCSIHGHVSDELVTPKLHEEESIRNDVQKCLSSTDGMEILALLEGASLSLPRTHYLIVSLYKAIALWYSSLARYLDAQGMKECSYGTPADLYLQSVASSIEAIKRMECCNCVPTACTNQTCDRIDHPPFHFALSEAFIAGQNLLLVSKEHQELAVFSEFSLVITKYLEHMRLEFGATDVDVMILETSLKQKVLLLKNSNHEM